MTKISRLLSFVIIGSVAASALPVTSASAGPREDILAKYAAQAKAADPNFKGFSAKRGEAFYFAVNTDGSPETPSCSTCHGKDPTQAGHLRTGKVIDPIALSANSDVFTSSTRVEKWFGRQCKGVVGRDCTPTEKGDYITFLMTK